MFQDFKSLQRNQQLPADPGTTRYPGASNLQNAEKQYQQTPLGAPPADCDVRSIYDSRPVNGFDFNIAVSVDNAEETPDDTFNLEFVVDEGYVAVVRTIYHWFEPLPALANPSDVLLSMAVNGATQLRLQDIPVGVESSALVNQFLIADEFNTVRAQLFLPGGAIATDFTVWVIFYGNYLQKTAIPANQQIANCTGSFPPRVVPPVAVEPPRPPPAPMPAPTPQPFPQELTPAPKSDLCPIVGRGGKVTYGPCPTRGILNLRGR